LFAASGVHFIDQTHAIAALVRVVSVAIGVGFVLRGRGVPAAVDAGSARGHRSRVA
jgi:hypothetical protein